ncbi:hypothetical protein M426DRAFT_68909 [Hypoxylon sp. CI-4A]|nr:hypothetical protein M426DRAFT_68909 [Hypoxylon sp. CI-4A]
MVLLTMTPSIVEVLNKLGETNDNNVQVDQDTPDSTSSNEPSLKDPSVGNPISHGQIIDIWKCLKSEDGGKNGKTTRLEELLRGATIYTAEYKALMARLRREEEERSYERMLKKAPPRESFARRFPDAPMTHSFAEVNRPSNPEDLGDDFEHGDVQKQITLVINFLISIFGCGAALWLAARWWSVPARLFLSLGGSIVVAIAEVAVYSAYTWRMAEGEKNQKKAKELKEIVQTWVVGDDDNKKGKDAQPISIGDETKPETGLRQRIKNPT